MKNNIKIQSSRICDAGKPYVAIAMFTEKYAQLAERLNESLVQSELDYCIFNVPTVHKSISPNGSDELDFCKPNFISYAQELFQKPMLYLDCDTVICDNPSLIDCLSVSDCDFSIYNWLACSDNSAYVPLKNNGIDTNIWGYSHSIDYQSKDQLICSGAVQYWNNSPSAKLLLNEWKKTIEDFPGSQDDHCLDFAFNNLSSELQIKYEWLPKSYSRYAWWIFDKPVIDHPQIPFSGTYFKEIDSNDERKRCYIEKLSHNKLNIKKYVNIDNGDIYILENNLLKVIDNSDKLWI